MPAIHIFTLVRADRISRIGGNTHGHDFGIVADVNIWRCERALMSYQSPEDLAEQLAALSPGNKLYIPSPLIERMFPASLEAEESAHILKEFAESHGCAVFEDAKAGTMPCFTKLPA